MITQHTITASAWTAISTAGQSGSCWLDEDNDGAGGAVDVRIYHSAAGIPAAVKVTEGKRLHKPAGNDDIMLITADSESDIYYAKCANADDTAILSADMV